MYFWGKFELACLVIGQYDCCGAMYKCTSSSLLTSNNCSYFIYQKQKTLKMYKSDEIDFLQHWKQHHFDATCEMSSTKRVDRNSSDLTLCLQSMKLFDNCIQYENVLLTQKRCVFILLHSIYPSSHEQALCIFFLVSFFCALTIKVLHTISAYYRLMS